jgi:cold shock protein
MCGGERVRRAVACEGGSIRSVDRREAGWSVVQGKVKFFDEGRGFGFISRDSGEDVFVHVSNLQPGGPTALVEGQAVEFDIGPGRKCDEAKNVRVI